MRRRGPHASPDDDVLDVVVLEEEEREEDDYLRTLHALAVAAMALRATSPGDPRPLAEPAEPSTGSPDDGAPPGLRHRLRRRGTRLGAAAAVVALGVVVGATVLDARHDAARLTLLRADPAVLAEVTAPPVELWRAEGSPEDDVAPAGPAAAPAGTEEQHDLPGDARATWSWAADGSFDRGRVLVGRERAYALPGPLLLPAVTDGSFPAHPAQRARLG